MLIEKLNITFLNRAWKKQKIFTMYRAIPTSNKLLQKKWADKEREIHLAKLKEIRPTVEIREPSQFRHLKKKLKKTQMLEGKSATDIFIMCSSIAFDTSKLMLILLKIDTLRSKGKTGYFLRR
jgi:ribosomal protein S4